MPSLKAWWQRPSGLIKRRRKRKCLNWEYLDWHKECFIGVNILNQSEWLLEIYYRPLAENTKPCGLNVAGKLRQGILKGEVSLYHWPPAWLVWNQLHDYWQYLFLFVKQTNPNQSNRRSMVHWYFPLQYSLAEGITISWKNKPSLLRYLSRWKLRCLWLRYGDGEKN